MDRVETLTAPDCTIGESPVWRAAEGALYWVDIPVGRIHRLHVASGTRAVWTLPEMVGCISFDRAGRVVAGMQSGVKRIVLGEDGGVDVATLGAPDFPMPGMRFNDGRCDRQGRFWAGTMHMDMPAAHAVGGLYRYTARDGLSAPFVEGLLTQNGLAWSPDGRRMYLSDSHPRAALVWTFDYDTDTGTPSNRRVFVDMRATSGRPDGAAVDEDGCYWICANDGSAVLRYTPDGKLDRSLSLPVTKPTMCAFGGAALDTLFVTSIRPADPALLATHPLAGAVFALHPGVRGLPEPEFDN